MNQVVAKYGDVSARQKKDLMIDADRYAVPFHIRSDGGWARKDIWDAVGIDVTKLETYDELRDACMQISDSIQRDVGLGHVCKSWW